MKKFIAFLTEKFRNRRPNLSLIKGIIMTDANILNITVIIHDSLIHFNALNTDHIQLSGSG